ncbi:hypothetical protein [Streptomyces chartreusis]|uniref:hypothetical protein n=1 Tax=Streptomyces chartreusis TaxID=1969 RepID=UPI00381D54D9
MLAEVFAHHPLLLGPVPVRRRRRVRDHHPNATGTPNLAELHQAGLRPGTTRPRFAAALVHPLTPLGTRATTAGIAADLRGPSGIAPRLRPPWPRPRTCSAAGPPWCAASSCRGCCSTRSSPGPPCWWSTLGSIPSTAPEPRPRSKPADAYACTHATAPWLPYGDLHHYAHSAHPAVRWNYLPALDRYLATPHFTPDALLVGPGSVARRHLEALIAGPVAAPTPVATPSRTSTA